MSRPHLLLAGVLLSAGALADADGQSLNFVSCPVVRDTPTVPCWLAEHDGELYYLGIQTDVSSDFHPPLQGHQVIVEGHVTDQPRICGGIVLDPVVVSPVVERDDSCNRQLPADERYVIDFNPRPPGPSGGRLAFDDAPRRQAPQAPQPPYKEREFTVRYQFDATVGGRHARDLTGIFNYARQVSAGRLEITGYAGDLLLSDGSLLQERPDLARERAEEVAALLRGAGLEEPELEVRWERAAEADGIEDWRGRRTVVRVVPGEER